MQEGPVLGTFPLIQCSSDREALQLSATFTVPLNEYLRWNRGNQPHLVFLKPDGQHGTIAETIDLTPEIGSGTTGKARLAGGAQ